jgi:hypothetical protein
VKDMALFNIEKNIDVGKLFKKAKNAIDAKKESKEEKKDSK